MLKKSLLASIALLSINPVLATQHMQTPAHGATNCPPCPCGGVQGWVLIPAGPGTPCHQGADAGGETTTTHEEVVTPHHHPAAPHHTEPTHHHTDPAAHHTEPTPHKPPMHPEGRTPEQQKLEDELHPITPHIFLRANPHSPTPNKKEGEWGKEHNGKVYFRHLGNWVYDPSVKPSDIVSTGVKDKIKMFNAGGPKTPVKTEAPAVVKKEAPAEVKVEAAAEAGVVPPPPPPLPPAAATTTGSSPRKKWPTVQVPDALGTTARVNTVDEKGRPIQGSFNRAQTGQTGGPAPRIDASANSPQPAGN